MMRKETYASYLGITHLEAAMLLDVSQTQWSMHSSGQRSLPTNALLLLSEMMVFVNHAEQSAKSNPVAADLQVREYLKWRLQETNYKHGKLSRKLADIEKKLQTQARRELLLEFIEKRKQNKNDTDHALPRLKRTLGKVKLSAVDLVKLQHELELLDLERNLLEGKLEGL